MTSLTSHGPPHRRRDWRTPILCLAAGIAASFLAFRSPDGMPRPGWPMFALGCTVAGGWLWFCAWTWRRLARMRENAADRRTFDFGVLGWGLLIWVTSSVVQAVQDVSGLAAENVLSARFTRALLFHSVIHFPLALCGGYLWGRGIGFVFPPPPPPMTRRPTDT